MQMFSRIFFIISIVLLSACEPDSFSDEPQTKRVGNTTSLHGLEIMYNNSGALAGESQNMTRVREMGIKDSALSIGAQSGLAHRAKQIDEELIKHTESLDLIYDFNAIILAHNILPPVLLEGHNTFNLPDTQSIRISNRVYKVLKQAKFVTTAPNWRQYLWLDYRKPNYPDITLLPKNAEEKKVWQSCVRTGWNNGIEQANTILEDSIARLKEDFTGMILYRKLLAMNMVSPPYVSDTDLGVTGDSQELHINDRVLRITALPALNTDIDAWRAAVSTDDTEKLETFDKMEHLVTENNIKLPYQKWNRFLEPQNND
jgi:defect in organelle trafficking protein DotC